MIVSIIIKYKLPMTYIVDEIIKNAMWLSFYIGIF
jgi:hypothetical protein